MSLLRLGVGKKRASAVVQIAFGAKTRSGHGGVPLGVAAGAAITGENSTDFVIDERGHIVPSGTYGAYKAYAATTYTLTVAGLSKPLQINIVANQAHIREVTAVAEGGTATANVDTTSTCQLKTVLGVNLGQPGALVGGDTVVGRTGHFNPTAHQYIGGLAKPAGGYNIPEGTKITVTSETKDTSIDANGNYRRGGSFKIGALYFLSGDTTDWSMLEFDGITFYTDYAALAANQLFIRVQAGIGVLSPNITNCRLELGPNVVGNPQSSFAGVAARKGLKFTNNYVKGLGNGLLGGLDAAIVSRGNVFEAVGNDCHRMRCGGHVIEDNFAFNFRPGAGAHADFFQIENTGTSYEPSVIRRNIVVRNVGEAGIADTAGIFGGPVSPLAAADWIVENNVLVILSLIHI